MLPAQSDYLVFIPARLESQRLPQKMLLPLGGKPLIVQTALKVLSHPAFKERTYVACGHPQIAQVLEQYQIPFVLTPAELGSGTERVFCAYETIKKQLMAQGKISGENTLVTNWQGDEPFLNGDVLLPLIKAMQSNSTWSVGTVGYPFQDAEDFFKPSSVKALLDNQGTALTFTRAPVALSNWATQAAQDSFWQTFAWKNLTQIILKHIGLYVYRSQELEWFCKTTPTYYEQMEKLEQLRFIYSKKNIGIINSAIPSLAIDTQEDMDEARRLWVDG